MANSCVVFFFFFFFFLSIPFVIHCWQVNLLPGFRGVLPFELETGYVGVGESEEVQLFYYFIKSERDPREDPLLVWLSGGPGCSSISGLVLEIGPLQFKVVEYNGTTPSLLSFPDSWTKVASIIFLDQPVGTGFSYSTTPRGWLEASDLTSAWQVDQFIRKWLLRHPEYLSNPFYVGGDSYSGKTVPPITLRISDGNDQGVNPKVNLKGYILGNPVTDVRIEENAGVQYAYRMGYLSDELYESLLKHCRGEYQIVSPGNVECVRALEHYNKCVKNLNLELVTDDVCDVLAAYPRPECKDYYFALTNYWANDEAVQHALRIPKGTVGKFIRCNYSIPYTSDVQSGVPFHANLSGKGYRSLIYSGDHDMLVPHVATQAWIKGLKYGIVDEWRPWREDGQIRGYTRKYANQMTFATIKGGGHTAEYNRHPYYVMFRRWIDGEPL